MKQRRFVITANTYGKIGEVEQKLTNRMINGDNLSRVRVFEVQTVYEPVVKLKKRKP